MSEVQYTEADIKRLKAMAQSIRQRPDSAGEFLNYAYGLGFCQGASTTAKHILSLTEKPGDAAEEGSGERK